MYRKFRHRFGHGIKSPAVPQQCAEDTELKARHLSPTIPGPLGAVVSNDWCIKQASNAQWSSRKRAVTLGYSTTLATSRLPADGSTHLCVSVNLCLNIDFFQVYLNIYTGESETLDKALNIVIMQIKILIGRRAVRIKSLIGMITVWIATSICHRSLFMRQKCQWNVFKCVGEVLLLPSGWWWGFINRTYMYKLNCFQFCWWSWTVPFPRKKPIKSMDKQYFIMHQLFVSPASIGPGIARLRCHVLI